MFKQLTDKLKKGTESKYYVAVVPVNPLGEVLVGERREDGIWTTPCGGAEGGEDPVEVAIRECWEEAGLKIDRSRLEFLRVKMAPNGRAVYCFLYRSPMEGSVTTKLDPDKEIKMWNWVLPESEMFPKEFQRKSNLNRLETINEAMLKFHGLTKSEKNMSDEKKDLEKGGPGSGQKGHTTAPVLEHTMTSVHPKGTAGYEKDHKEFHGFHQEKSYDSDVRARNATSEKEKAEHRETGGKHWKQSQHHLDEVLSSREMREGSGRSSVAETLARQESGKKEKAPEGMGDSKVGKILSRQFKKAALAEKLSKGGEGSGKKGHKTYDRFNWKTKGNYRGKEYVTGSHPDTGKPAVGVWSREKDDYVLHHDVESHPEMKEHVAKIDRNREEAQKKAKSDKMGPDTRTHDQKMTDTRRGGPNHRSDWKKSEAQEALTEKLQKGGAGSGLRGHVTVQAKDYHWGTMRTIKPSERGSGTVPVHPEHWDEMKAVHEGKKEKSSFKDETGKTWNVEKHPEGGVNLKHHSIHGKFEHHVDHEKMQLLGSGKVEKGGEGSGKVGHTTARQALSPAEKLKVGLKNLQPKIKNKLQTHLESLKNGAVLPDVATASGKPIVNDMNAARAHKYTLQDHLDAVDVHHKHAKRIGDVAEKLKTAGRAVPKEAQDMVRHHVKQMKAHMREHDSVEMKHNQMQMDKEKKNPGIKKSGSASDAEDLSKGAWKEVMRQGIKYYASGPHSGKVVGSIRGNKAKAAEGTPAPAKKAPPKEEKKEQKKNAGPVLALASQVDEICKKDHDSRHRSIKSFFSTQFGVSAPTSSSSWNQDRGTDSSYADVSEYNGVKHYTIELGLDRYRRHDHGGGENGDGWLDSSEIESDQREGAETYGKLKQRVEASLKEKGIDADVNFNLGEKGHFSLAVSFSTPRDSNHWISKLQNIKDPVGTKVKAESGTIWTVTERDEKGNYKVSNDKGEVARLAPEKQYEIVKKAQTQMGGSIGDPDVDTGSFAQAQSNGDQEFIQRLYREMNGFVYGQDPVQLQLDKGILHLSKVDDGMYSGYFTNKDQDGLLDNARVRIDKINIPDLAGLCAAKEWNSQLKESMTQLQPPQAVNDIYSDAGDFAPMNPPQAIQTIQKDADVMPAPPQEPPMAPNESQADKTIRILSLLSKLTGN